MILMVLDGWGIGNHDKSDAIYNANTPFVDSLYTNYPHTTLLTSGENVGLPDGQMGNSEVGHLNIGAGRVVWQQLVLINKAFREKSVNQNPTLVNAFNYAKANHKKVHFIGLVSDGGVHSSIDHLKGLCDIADEAGVKDVFIHAFLDGRDCDPKSGKGFIENVQNHIQDKSAKIASIIGRYYAMDRDKRWERIKLAYDLMVHGTGTSYTDPVKAVQASYDDGITDEFCKPKIITDANRNPIAKIEEGDVVICFNFRTDRGREITMALMQQEFPEQNMHPLNLKYITMTQYDATFKGVDIIFDNKDLVNTLGEVISANGLKQIRAAETEKYPHVTFFFSGGREEEFPGEKRIMAPSPKVATYDLQPEMSAYQLRDSILAEIENNDTDFMCINFANPDMVGHTGVYEAIIKAVETVDGCVKDIVTAGLEKDYTFIIIADHGNADFAINDDGSPNTAHTTNPVPCFLIDNHYKPELQAGKLADIAPTVIQLMGLTKPTEMDGVSIIKN